MGHTMTMPPQNVSRRKQIFQLWIRPVSMMKPGDMHDRALFATRAALRELAKLVDDGFPREDFQTMQGFLKNYTVNYGSTLSCRLGYRLDDVFYGIPEPGHMGMIKPEVDKLTLEAVNAAIRTHLQYENLWVVFLTRDAQGVKAKLLSGKDTPISKSGRETCPPYRRVRSVLCSATMRPAGSCSARIRW